MSRASDHRERPDSRRGWLVAAVGGVAMAFTLGTALSYGVFRGPFSAAFGIAPVALSGGFAGMLLTLYVGSGLVGVFGTRFRSRRLLFGCALTTAVLAPSLYLTGSVLGLTAVFAALGLALGTAYVVLASVVPRWFDARRGAATGVIFVGNGLGLTLLPPIWQFAFAEVGVRRGFALVMSATTLAFLAAAVVCRRPRWVDHSSASAAELFEWLSELSGSRRFRLLFVGIALSFAWYPLIAAYVVDLFAARGLSAAGASAAFGLIGGVSIASRIGGGYLADRAGPRRTFLAALACVGAGVAALSVPTLGSSLLAIALIGLGLGGVATLYIPLLMGIYPSKLDTAIVGLFNIAIGVGSLAMPPLGTASITYTEGFSVAIALTFLAVLGALWAVAAGTSE